MYLTYTFIFFACMLSLMIVVYKIYIQKRPRTQRIACYLSGLTWVFALYIVSALVLALFTTNIVDKILVGIFALSPFIVGRFATYEKETLYSYIQICCAFISIIYVYLRIL